MVIDGDRHETSKVDIDFKEFVESLPVGIYQVDMEGRFVYCNKVMADILGYSDSSELIGKEINNFYYNPEDRERLINKMRNEEGRFLDETLHWKNRENNEIYLSDSCQFIRDGKGKEVGVRGVLVEVWYRKVFDEMNEGIYQIGPDQETLVKANNAVARMLGLNYADEIKGKKVTDFYKDPKDLEKLKKVLFEKKKVENYPIEMVKKSGEELVVSVNATPIRNEKGEIVGREGTFRDITEDYKIRKILEDMPTGAYQVKNKDGKDCLSYCNKAFAEMFGYVKPEEVIGKDVEVLYAHKGALDRFRQELREADARGGSLLDYRLRVKKRTGERFWVEIDSRFLKDHKKNIIGRQGTLRDATIRIQLEEILRQREDVQRFSHRFMAPIMSIKSSSDTLLEEVKQSIEWELLGDIREILEKLHGDPFTLLKEIKHLSKRLLNILEDFISSIPQSEGENFISQLRTFAHHLREFSDEKQIADIIELRETHRDIRICLFEYLVLNPELQKKVANILNYIEVLEKLYILYVVQTITNTSKIAYTEVENLRSYLLGWDGDKNRKEKPYEYTKENLYECIKEVVNIYQIYAFEKEIAIEMSVDPFLEIEMAKEDLKKMLHNLIQNAVKYSYKGKQNIRIRDRINLKEVEIEITNSGVGILPDELKYDKIFETGYRGQLSYDWNRTGSGIGLSEALKISQRHGGNITITSNPVGEREPGEDPKIPYFTKVKVKLPKFHRTKRRKV